MSERRDSIDPQALAALRADVVSPDEDARQRISNRLARSIGALAVGASAEHEPASSREPSGHIQNLRARPPGKFGVLARLWRAPERNVPSYVSTGAQPKQSENPKSPGVPTGSNSRRCPAPSMVRLKRIHAGRALRAAVASAAAASGLGIQATALASALVLGGVVGAGLHRVLTVHSSVVPAAPAVPERRVPRHHPVASAHRPHGAHDDRPAPLAREAEQQAQLTPGDASANVAAPVPVPVPAPSESAEPAPAEPGPHAGAHSPHGGMAEQQELLDRARGALLRFDYGSCLAALHAHYQRFPRSVFAEEREALEIQALVAAGRRTEAEARATRFDAHFPNSVLWPAIKDSLRRDP